MSSQMYQNLNERRQMSPRGEESTGVRRLSFPTSHANCGVIPNSANVDAVVLCFNLNASCKDRRGNQNGVALSAICHLYDPTAAYRISSGLWKLVAGSILARNCRISSVHLVSPESDFSIPGICLSVTPVTFGRSSNRVDGKPEDARNGYAAQLQVLFGIRIRSIYLPILEGVSGGQSVRLLAAAAIPPMHRGCGTAEAHSSDFLVSVCTVIDPDQIDPLRTPVAAPHILLSFHMEQDALRVRLWKAIRESCRSLGAIIPARSKERGPLLFRGSLALLCGNLCCIYTVSQWRPNPAPPSRIRVFGASSLSCTSTSGAITGMPRSPDALGESSRARAASGHSRCGTGPHPIRLLILLPYAPASPEGNKCIASVIGSRQSLVLPAPLEESKAVARGAAPLVPVPMGHSAVLQSLDNDVLLLHSRCPHLRLVCGNELGVHAWHGRPRSPSEHASPYISARLRAPTTKLGRRRPCLGKLAQSSYTLFYYLPGARWWTDEPTRFSSYLGPAYTLSVWTAPDDSVADPRVVLGLQALTMEPPLSPPFHLPSRMYGARTACVLLSQEPVPASLTSLIHTDTHTTLEVADTTEFTSSIAAFFTCTYASSVSGKSFLAAISLYRYLSLHPPALLPQAYQIYFDNLVSVYSSGREGKVTAYQS
ncbi:hypothetical protein R3P38DRAFT_3470484 [Favolaschia claudopus]|uniref:Uncharacterized protein n=1 Tax=Favolaschia claudopus TaxID=2862362 RepID=A0AAV9ZCN1_9AGAR